MQQRAHSESGTALIMSLFFAIIVTGVVATGSIYLRTHRLSSETKFQVYSQATQFARSGLTETLSWFRRQSKQPVLRFEPIIDEAADPPIVDTLDSDIGIVREFRISGSTWGRYEVWKEWDNDPNPEQAEWRQQMQASDISESIGLGSTGSAWRVRAVGYLYQNNDPDVAFDAAPNRVLASRILESEIIRLKITPPGQAALSIARGGQATVNNFGRVNGGSQGAGLFYGSGTGTPSTGNWWEYRVIGSPAQANSSSYDDSYRSVFGISYQELRGIADSFLTDGADFPSPVPTNGVIVCEAPTVTFDNTRPLRGSGLVVVKGNCVINAGSQSTFTGFLYVDGNLTINAPADLTGAVVVTGSFLSQGSGDFATVTFDDDALTALRLEIGQYRLSGAIRPVHGQE